MHKDLRRRLIGPSNENVQDPTFVVRRGNNMLYEPKRLEILVKLDSVGVDRIFQVDIEIPNHSNGTPKSHKFLQKLLEILEEGFRYRLWAVDSDYKNTCWFNINTRTQKLKKIWAQAENSPCGISNNLCGSQQHHHPEHQ